MAARQVPNRSAAVGRGFLGGALTVAAYGALYLLDNNYLPGESSTWGKWFDEYVVPLLAIAGVTVLIATVAGLLIEQLIPPLRVPARDITRWVVVLGLGLTLGPVSVAIGYDIYQSAAATELAPLQPARLIAISVLAYFLAELLMGRGKSTTSR
jgi:hypothetical protein